MALNKRVGNYGIEYEYASYDKDVTATFNSYSIEELTDFRILMRQIGGIKVVAYELYKHDNKYSDNQKVTLKYCTIVLHDKGDKTMIVTVEELAYMKSGYRKENNGSELNYTLVGEDLRTKSVKSHFYSAPKKMIAYKTRVNAALNYNKGSNKDTTVIAAILNKCAGSLQRRKDNQHLRVSRWLMDKREKPENTESIQSIRNAIDDIKPVNQESHDENGENIRIPE